MTALPADGSIPRHHVPNQPLREAFLRDGRSAEKIAETLGLYRYVHRPRKDGVRRKVGDGSAVKRALGLYPERQTRTYRQYMRDTNALRYARVLGIEPHELGL